VYYLADDAVVILDVFSKKTRAMPNVVLSNCRRRLAAYFLALSSTERSLR
jgi:phage-related protein